MHTTVTFKNLDSSDHLRTYVQDKLKRLDKYLENPAEASVVLTVEKFRHIAEVNLSGDRLNIIGKEETHDMYLAIDMVLDKLETQIKRGKAKSRDHRSSAKSLNRSMLPGEGEIGEEDVERLVKIKHIDYKPMDVDEAIMQMDLQNGSFLVFTNAKSGQINVLYRRNDGHYGLIQPAN